MTKSKMKKFHQLVDKRLLGEISSEESKELDVLKGDLDSRADPHTQQLLQSVSQDRRLIKQSLKSIETALTKLDAKIQGPDVLDSKENQVLTMLLEGTRAAEIATKLELSSKTVLTYRVNLMRKLDIHNVAEFVKFGERFDRLSSMLLTSSKEARQEAK